MFETKVAIVVLGSLAVWQKLNVAAFLATGIAAAAPEAIGESYQDALGRTHGRLLGQPILIFKGSHEVIVQAYRVAIARDLQRAVYVQAMFGTGHDAANRAVFMKEPADAPNLVGIALRGPKKAVDKAIKGAVLHP